MNRSPAAAPGRSAAIAPARPTTAGDEPFLNDVHVGTRTVGCPGILLQAG